MDRQFGQSFRSLSLGNHDVDLFLLGKTGNGKSATGNSILQKPRCFKAKASTQSVTDKIHFDYSVFCGRTIKVVDAPGVGDTRMSNEEALKMIQERMTQAIAANVDGYHAFLLVVRYGGRFTREDVQTIECLKKIFGMDFVKNFCIVVLTYGDNFDPEEAGMTFDRWLQNQQGVFNQLIQECNNRAIMFDNKTKDATKKIDQVARLLSIVDSLGGYRYTDEHFEKAKHLRERQILESKEPRVREETLRNTAVLMKKLRDIQTRDPKVQPEDLKKMKTDAKNLYQSVKDLDRGTGVLNYSLEAASSIVEQVKRQLEYCGKIISDRKKAEEEQKRLHQEHLAKLKEEKEMHERQLAEEKKLQEERRAKEKKQKEMEWEQQRKKEEQLQQEKLEALKKEMADKTEQERLWFQEVLKKQAEEAEQQRRENQEFFQRMMQQQFEENERRRRQQEEQFERQQEEERWRREREERRRQDMLEEQLQDQRRQHEREMEFERRRSEEAYEKAKAQEENSIWGNIKKIGSGIWGVVKKIIF